MAGNVASNAPVANGEHSAKIALVWVKAVATEIFRHPLTKSVLRAEGPDKVTVEHYNSGEAAPRETVEYTG